MMSNSIRRQRLAAIVFSAGMGLTFACTAAPADGGSIQALIAQAKPGSTITLPPGDYPESGVKANPSAPVTILGPGAIIHGLQLDGSSNLIFRGEEFVVQPRTGLAIGTTNGSRNLAFDQVNIHRPAGGAEGTGVFFRNSSNVSITNSDIHDVAVGIQHLNTDHVTIARNSIHDITGDGIHGAGTSFITIDGNRIFNLFTQPGDHPDAIQFFTYGQTAGATDITITNNDIRQGKGGPVQGIFLGNESNLPYSRVRITGNLVMGGMWNGIAVGIGIDPVVEDNYVQAHTDNWDDKHTQVMTPWIVLESTGGSLKNNVSTAYLLDKAVGLAQAGNAKIGNAKPGDYSGAEKWLHRHDPGAKAR